MPCRISGCSLQWESAVASQFLSKYRDVNVISGCDCKYRDVRYRDICNGLAGGVQDTCVKATDLDVVGLVASIVGKALCAAMNKELRS